MSVKSKLGYGRLTKLGIFTFELHWPPKKFTQPPTLTPAVTVCLLKAGDR